jgi:DNA polymerase-1
MVKEKKLLLLDCYALIFRAYYAFISNPMRNTDGMNTSPVFGFLLALDDVLKKEDPTHVLAAFDASGPTFRHEMYDQYKANRDATPEDIKTAVPWVKEVLKAYHIPVVEEPGFEADDLIGTVAKQAEKEAFDVLMMTPDKDFAQLVSERIRIYKPGRSGKPAEVIGPEEVRQIFHVEHPDQVVDILALWGDASDNIPGVPGVGEKTAKKLIEKYGSTENIYVHIDELKGKQKENFLQSIEQVKLSKELARIITRVPVSISLDEMHRKPVNEEALERLFSALEFKNIGQRILGKEIPLSQQSPGAQTSLFDSSEGRAVIEPPPENTIHTTSHKYELVTDDKGFNLLMEQLSRQEEFCFDTETTGLEAMRAELVGIAFSWEKHTAHYVDFGKTPGKKTAWLERLNTLFSDSNKRIIGQNLKYDLHILKNYNIDVKGRLFDTMVSHDLLHPGRKHGLDTMAMEYFGYTKIKTEDLIGKKSGNQLSFDQIDPEKVKEYAGEDADITWQLYQIMEKELEEHKLRDMAERVEFPLVRVLMEMEHAGVALDTESLKDFAITLRKELIDLEKSIYDCAGREFNISSPKQLGEILFDEMKLVKEARKTKTKQYSTNEEVLVKLADEHEIVRLVLDYRSSKKLLSTYVDALPKLIDSNTGKIHASFNQTLVATGRLSSNKPNLQNIPIREERGREIRRAFRASSEKHCFLSADYSQIELRLMAHFSQDNNMIAAFVNNEDIHTATAARVFGVDADKVTREMRTKAKTANFGIIYGISAFGLAQRMRIARTEAKELIEGYFTTYPGVRKYMDECIENARNNGYVETLLGRKRYLPDILSRNSVVRGNAERNAINTPIQGTAADIIKIAMVNIFKSLKNNDLKTNMIIQVHDELNFDVPRGELDQVKQIVRHEMEHAMELDVPMVVEMNHGTNWFEAH